MREGPEAIKDLISPLSAKIVECGTRILPKIFFMTYLVDEGDFCTRGRK